MYRCGTGPNNAMPYDGESPAAATSSAVDCMLSLATPAATPTLTGSDHYDHNRLLNDQTRRRPSAAIWSSSAYNFCWDNNNILPHSSPPNSHKPNHAVAVANAVADPLLARRCANCDTTSTPLWRNGPRGPKSLCNACGIRFKKEERRANSAATGGGGDTAEAHQYLVNGNPWIHQHTQTGHKLPSCYSPAAKVSEFRFIDDRDSPFVSWRLNLSDRAGLVHGFTR